MSKSLNPKLRLFVFALAAACATGCSVAPAPNFGCADGGCGLVCSMLAAGCADGEHCCPGLKCAKGSCAADCSLLTEACSATVSCCPGMECGPNGTCKVPCAKVDAGCAASADCCSGFGCAAGVCACLAEGDVCGGPSDVPCCAGTSCDGTGHCRAPCPLPVGACQPYGGACTVDGGDCCASGVCPRGQCSDPSTLSTCAQEGAACASTSDCCGNSAFGSQLDCLPRGADGGNLCHLAKAGELCDVAHHCLPGVNCVYPPPPDAGAGDGGVDDGGTTDAGSPPPDAGTGAGVCTITKTGTSCTLYTPNCGAGDGCNPSSSTNQGYDPCYLKVNGTNLADRTSLLLCNGGYCAQPNEGDPCSSTCTQTVGDPRRTSCLSFYDNSKLCMPACSTDADCHGATFYDGSLNNPQRVTNYCVNYGNGAGCQPLLCFVEGQAGPAGKVASLYKPCMGHPNTLCLPRFVGADSNIEGYCIAVKPGTAPTVGQVCDPRAGREALAANCGKDAVCLGGRCAAVCDASALGLNGTPGCSKDQTCISPQGLDLIADYQFGGCADGCDPFTDLEHSGCVNYCGGSGAVCNWIIGDPVPNLPRGYCGAALKQPIRIGQACSTDTAVDQCEAGSYCLLGGVRRTCTRLCDPTVDAGTPDACASGQSCTAFTRLPRSGYCH